MCVCVCARARVCSCVCVCIGTVYYCTLVNNLHEELSFICYGVYYNMLISYLILNNVTLAVWLDMVGLGVIWVFLLSN
jgi:hypothetical protein